MTQTQNKLNEMIEIVLNSTHSFIEAEMQIQNLYKIAGNPDYKPRILIIKEYEKYKTYEQMKAIRSLIQELWNSGMHSCPVEKCSLELFTDYIKKDVIQLLIIKEKWDSKHNDIIKRYEAKSMADYTKKEMTQAIENVLTYIKECGCNTIKIEKIIEGMNKEQNEFEKYYGTK